MNTKEKYEDIKVSMLPEKTRDTLEKIRRATKDFTIKNEKADAYVSAVHNKLKKEKPEGLRSEDKKPEPKKAEPKKPAAKKPEPVKKPEPAKKPTKTQAVQVKASLSKLEEAIANDPLLKGLGKTDKTRDAGRRALPAGRRVSKKGWKNQYGKSSGGRVYYENRENRSDRKSPNYKGGYPYLAMGGYTHKGDEGGEFYVKIYTERDGKIVDIQEREYRDKDSAMTFAMMKGNFLNKGQSVFVMDEDGDVIYKKVSMKAKGGYMEHGGKVERNYAEWEMEVTQTLADKLGIDYGDASGIVEAQPFYMQQSWTKGLSASETADVIDEKSVMAKGGLLKKGDKIVLLGDDYEFVKYETDSSQGYDEERIILKGKDGVKSYPKDMVEAYSNYKMAKGGLTEHGLKKGDTIKDNLFWENAITVKDKDGKFAKVNLDKGIRKESMAKGGKIGFDALAAKVAKRYEGKKVPAKYQKEYGKKYDKQEAQEVGDKVAAKVYRQQLRKAGKMAKGGEILTFEEFKKELPPVQSPFYSEEGIIYKPAYNRYTGRTMYYKNGRRAGKPISVKYAYEQSYLYDAKKGKMAEGGKLDQGFNDRLDESMGNRNGKESKMDSTLKDRRNEAKGENKAVGKRPYSSVHTMDKMADGGEMGKITLPHNLKKYFTKPAGTKEVELSSLIPTRAREKGIANAERYMRLAYDGKMERRKPITIYKSRNGKYRVYDGNSTFAVAKKHGWKTIWATVISNPNATARKEKSVFTIAKQIRKEGEPWKDAVKRASAMNK